MIDTSFVPPLIYAVMGTSRDIAIGPVAVISLLLSSMAQKVVDPSVDPTAYRKLVITSTFFAGVFQASFGFFRLLLLAFPSCFMEQTLGKLLRNSYFYSNVLLLFRLGFIVDFLSHATIVGFMGGAAIVIGLQQLKGLLGISHFTNNTDVVSVVKAVWVAVHHSVSNGN